MVMVIINYVIRVYDIEAVFDLPETFCAYVDHHDGCSNCKSSSKWEELQITPYLLNESFLEKFTSQKNSENVPLVRCFQHLDLKMA